jgi:hypothetical protein
MPSTEEKTIRNSVPWNKNRNKLSKFHSEPFRRRENTSEVQLGIPFCGTKIVSRKLSECHSELFRGRENNSEQNGAAENFKNSVRKDNI